MILGSKAPDYDTYVEDSPVIIIHLITIITLAAFYICYGLWNHNLRLPKNSYLVLVLIAFVIRVLFACFYHGFDTDVSCFAAWADRMYLLGPGGFYSPDVFTDYPPGYMYLLYPIGVLRSWLRIPNLSGMHLLLLKLPAIVCDLAAGVLLYKTANKRFSETQSLLISLLYMLNPAVLLNSSLWGQMDSVFTLALIILCLSLTKGRMLPAYLSFGIGVLLKPQMLIFTPLLLVAMLRSKKLLRHTLQGLFVALGMVLLCIPFGLSNVLSQYITTLSSYPYASVNAYNFWGFFGLNWTSQDTSFLFLDCKTWGMLVIIFLVLITLFIGVTQKEKNTDYFLLGSFLILTMFAFSVRMHERYLYPGLVLLLFAYLFNPCDQLYLSYGIFTILHFYNTAHVMFTYDPKNYDRQAPFILLLSASMVLGVCYFYSVFYRLYYKQTALPRKLPSKKLPTYLKPRPSSKKIPITGRDLILMLCITLLYSGFALHDLGDRKAPETTYEMKQGESILLKFKDTDSPATLSYYMGPLEKRRFAVETLNEQTNVWEAAGELVLDTVFTWKSLSLQEIPDSTRQLRLTLKSPQAYIIKLVFTDDAGNVILPENAGKYPSLFDEEALFPERFSFRNSMYFDEIYHARTAYEYLHGMYSYENTHPPLGKILISIGIALFGMNPFGWRIMGTLFGILMVPIAYVFGKQFFKNTPCASLTCVLFTFDFMHFAQTRLATIDVYITFFVILMYYFMYRYTTLSFYDMPLWKTLIPLGLSGICMGLGIACKWTGVYAGAGLAVIFFGTLYRRFQEYQYARSFPKKNTNGISHTQIVSRFAFCLKRTIFFCIGAFVCIPLLIYTLSYLPFMDNSGDGLITKMLNNQVTMFHYHSSLVAEHAFSSPFYKWPAMVRPIWYYSGIVSEAVREGISSFGNPLVWWAGILAFPYILTLAIRKKDKYAAFLTIGYLAQYLPWFFVSRLTFIYHYFPSVFFVVLMIVYCFLQAKSRLSNRSFCTLLLLYGFATFFLFALFYPVLSGQPIEAAFVDKWLRWFDSWVLVAR